MATDALTPVKNGAETVANSYTTDRQEITSVTALTDGSYIVVWNSMNQPGDNGWGVFAQRYDADGTPLGGEFHVNTTTGDHQGGATVIAQAGGAFTIVWVTWQGPTLDVVAQRFDTNGAKIGGEFTIAGGAGGHQTYTSATTLPDGSIVVSWQEVPLIGGQARQVMAQHFDADMNALGSAFVASDSFTPSGGSTALSDGIGSLIALGNGNIVSVWTQPQADDHYSDVWAQILTADGTPIGASFVVNTTLQLAQGQPAAAALENGSFVVAFYSDAAGGTVFQRFAADGAKLGGEVTVSNTPNGSITPSIVALADGGFVIAWQGGSDGDGSAVSAQRFSADGQAVGSNFILDTQTTLWQSKPLLTQLLDGTLVAGWTTEAYGRATDVATQQFILPLRLAGSTGDDVLTGGEGNDTLVGGLGKDTLIGGAGNDHLDGSHGNDTLIGGTGDDTYVVSHAGDVVIELSGEGIDTVKASISFALGENVEKLVLTGTGAIDGTGNGLANVLTGNSADNRLDGMGGNDTLIGAAGNDTLIGGAGDDRLDGGTGADSMAGGIGNDVYVVDDAGDLVLELAGAGIDTVKASISFTLADNVENLILVGSVATEGNGNALANVLTGNAADNRLSGEAGNDTLIGGAGDDILSGGLGNDRLQGGAGADAFRFASAGEGGDQFVDFAPGEDWIEISAAGFGGGLTEGQDLSTGGYFVAGSVANAAHGQFLFAGAKLYWDADGTGAGAKALIATLAAGTSLTAEDLHVIA